MHLLQVIRQQFLRLLIGQIVLAYDETIGLTKFFRNLHMYGFRLGKVAGHQSY